MNEPELTAAIVRRLDEIGGNRKFIASIAQMAQNSFQESPKTDFTLMDVVNIIGNTSYKAYDTYSTIKDVFTGDAWYKWLFKALAKSAFAYGLEAGAGTENMAALRIWVSRVNNTHSSKNYRALMYAQYLKL